MSRFFSLAPQHEHADPAQRVLGVAKLPPDASELAHMLAADPAPEVREATAARCADCSALAAALGTETDSAVRGAIASALGRALALTQDERAAQALLAAGVCTDAIRRDVVNHAHDAGRRRMAIACIRDEAMLIELALTAGHAETRREAAERVHTLEGWKALADAARNKDRGVATLARARVREITRRASGQAEADAVIAQLEALAGDSGLIHTAVVNLSHRWKALDMRDDAPRTARFDTAWQAIQVRFDRERREQQARKQVGDRGREWLDALAGAAVPAPDALARLREELAALRAEAQVLHNPGLLARLDEAEERIGHWHGERAALDAAEALLAEAEQLAASDTAGSADPDPGLDIAARWSALDPAGRNPATSRRFEAAMQAWAQRRGAIADAARQQQHARRQRLHELLNTAEQALREGQLQPARSAADEMKAQRANAGMLPKPTLQRLNQVIQRLAELERWETFGQQHAREQLCERAEALPAQELDVARLAQQVRKLRDEWKSLDKQHPGCPKALWERFDRACEKAYAPAAAHFEKQAASRKEARQRREEFIAEVAARAAVPPGEDSELRELDQWLRRTEQTWRDGKLGSVNPADWKGLEKKLQAALAPLRRALSDARGRARLARQALIEEAAAIAPQALERDAPSRIKAIQARWQQQAKSLSLEQREEQVLWQQFRAACNAVFEARDARRSEELTHKQDMRSRLEDFCARLEQLALDADGDEQAMRRSLRELREQWKSGTTRGDPTLRDLENRFNRARGAVEAALSARMVSQHAAVWKALAGKERLCRELDDLLLTDRVKDAAAEAATEAAADNSAIVSSPLPAAILQRWADLAGLPERWEQALTARRDEALQALSAGGAEAYLKRMRNHAGERRRWLVELEMALGLDTPAQLQAERRALQVHQLKERFSRGTSSKPEGAGELLFRWCAQPGETGPLDQERLDRIFERAMRLPVKLA